MAFKTLQFDPATGDHRCVDPNSEGLQSGSDLLGNSILVPWHLENAYSEACLVEKDGTVYKSNSSIPSNTPFLTGSSGQTWSAVKQPNDGLTKSAAVAAGQGIVSSGDLVYLLADEIDGGVKARKLSNMSLADAKMRPWIGYVSSIVSSTEGMMVDVTNYSWFVIANCAGIGENQTDGSLANGVIWFHPSDGSFTKTDENDEDSVRLGAVTLLNGNDSVGMQLEPRWFTELVQMPQAQTIIVLDWADAPPVENLKDNDTVLVTSDGTESGTVYRKVTVISGNYVVDGGPYPYSSGLAYEAGYMVTRNGTFYFANADVPANTPFAEGVTGATWRALNSPARREITKVTTVGGNGMLFIASGRLFTARGRNGYGSWNAAWGGTAIPTAVRAGINNAYEIEFPNEAPGVYVVDANCINTMTYALLSNGNLYTWGTNNQGQLGLGDTNHRFLPTLSSTSVSKVFSHPSGSSRTWENSRLFIQKTDGKVYCTGYNAQGQLGLGDTTNRIIWTENTAIGLNPKSVWVLGGHIGATFVQKADGTVIVCGYNGYGQLGDGTTTQRNSFVTVNAWLGGMATGIIKQIVSGHGYNDTAANDSCNITVLADDGTNTTLLSAGANSWSSVGNGGTSGNVLVPTAPLSVAGFAGRIKQIARSGDAPGGIWALKENGELWRWGYNGQGQLGTGTTAQQSSPLLVSGSTWLEMFQIACGPYYGYYTGSPILKKTDGTYWMSGIADNGQIGDGNITQTNTFRKISLPRNETYKGFGSLITDQQRMSFVAVTDSNKVFGWGYNGNFQLDANSNSDVLLPIDVTPECLYR